MQFLLLIFESTTTQISLPISVSAAMQFSLPISEFVVTKSN
jgi:hypothetical protein